MLVFAESVGVPVPGETALIAASILTVNGHLSLPLVIAIAAIAAVLGDNVGYLIGRRGGRWLLARDGAFAGRRRAFVVRGDAFFARHGAKAVFLGRFVPWLRFTAAWLAGTHRMPWPTFLRWNALGGIAWATAVGVAAHFLGRAAGVVLGTAGIVLFAMALLAVGALVAKQRFRRRPPAEVADPRVEPRRGDEQ